MNPFPLSVAEITNITCAQAINGIWMEAQVRAREELFWVRRELRMERANSGEDSDRVLELKAMERTLEGFVVECEDTRVGRAFLEAAADLLEESWDELIYMRGATYYGCHHCGFRTSLASASDQFRAETHEEETGHRVDAWVVGDSPLFDNPLAADERTTMEHWT